MTRYTKSLFEHEEKVIFGVTIILKMKVTVIKIKGYQLKNIIRLYLKDIIDYLKKPNMWKIQSTIS